MRINVTANESGSLTAKGGGKQRTSTPVGNEPHAAYRTAARAAAKVHGLSLFPHTETIDLSTGRAVFEV